MKGGLIRSQREPDQIQQEVEKNLQGGLQELRVLSMGDPNSIDPGLTGPTYKMSIGRITHQTHTGAVFSLIPTQFKKTTHLENFSSFY